MAENTVELTEKELLDLKVDAHEQGFKKAKLLYDMQSKVEEFHRAFQITIQDRPDNLRPEDRFLRIALINEELAELCEAIRKNDVVDLADAIGDLLYVVFGTAISAGITIADVFNEIHRSNMTKIGGYKAPDGKWIKPSTYSPAELLLILNQQGYIPF